MPIWARVLTRILDVTALKPSLGLLTALTDQHVLSALIDDTRLTRSELAAVTGISKPTISESVRRLEAAGLIRDTGERTSGRGRIGSYYALVADIGSALAISIAPEGMVAELLSVRGEVLARASRSVARPARPADVAAALSGLVGQVAEAGPMVRVAVVSAADPVDRLTGRLVSLPDTPFLVGDLDAVATVSSLLPTGATVVVDNDVNWAALAEGAARTGPPLDDFFYLYLGEGLGAAVVSDGEVRRGHAGLGGEIAHLVTTGADGRAVPFTEVFRQLGLRHRGSTAIDVAAVKGLSSTGSGRTARTALAVAVVDVLAAAVALTDPRLVVVGGSWGTHPPLIEAIRDQFAGRPRQVPVESATVLEQAPLDGARRRAVEDLRSVITGSRRVS